MGAEHLVEPDLERSNPGALPLARLQRGDVLLAAVAGGLEVVELAIVARLDCVALIELRGWPLHERAREIGADIGEQVECERQRVRAGHVGQPLDRIAQRTQLARCGASQRRAAREPLQVTHAVERLPEPLAPAAVLEQRFDGVEPRGDRSRLDERREQPAPEQAPAHGGERPVDDVEQGGPFRSSAERLDQLQVAARHLVERQHVAPPHDRGARQVGQAACAHAQAPLRRRAPARRQP